MAPAVCNLTGKHWHAEHSAPSLAGAAAAPPRCARGAPEPHLCTSAAAGWTNSHGLSQGGHGDVCPAWTLLMEPVCHIRGDSAFPLASSGHLSRSVNCQYSWSYVLYRHANLSLEFALKHNLFQHNWVILFANSVTVFREKLRHNLGCPAVRPLPLENKVKYIMPGEKCHSFPLHPVSLNFCNVAEFHRQSQVYMFGQLNYKTTNLSIPVFSFLCFQF